MKYADLCYDIEQLTISWKDWKICLLVRGINSLKIIYLFFIMCVCVCVRVVCLCVGYL